MAETSVPEASVGYLLALGTCARVSVRDGAARLRLGLGLGLEYFFELRRSREQTRVDGVCGFEG